MTGSVVVITGTPGAGKTTLAAFLANAPVGGAPRVHIESDIFYSFLARPISPLLPASHAQNETVIRAVARAAGAFALGGYEVFLDGIFGPWFLPVLESELGPLAVPVDYVVLRCDLALAIERAGARAKAPASADLVRQMHAALAQLGVHETHVHVIGELDTPAIGAEVARRRVVGEFRLAWSGPR